jgi:hypothetical protein
MSNKSLSSFLFFGLFLLVAFFADENGQIFGQNIWTIWIVIFVGRSIIRGRNFNFKKQDTNQPVESEYSFEKDDYDLEDDSASISTVECPYCGESNPSNETFCQKCKGLL